MKKYWWLGRLYWLRAVRWWHKRDKRWGVWWRLGNGLALLVLLAGVAAPITQQLFQVSQYKLSADTLGLIGKTNPALANQLSYDAQTQTYQFNQSAMQSQSTGGQAGVAAALAKMQAQVGTASGKGKDKSLYALDVPQNLSQGVTYHDVNTGLSFSLVPQFSTGRGEAVQGHLVYPLAGNMQAIYTLKNNGLKEDVVVQKTTEDSITLNYQLNLPDTLQAKVIPGSDGAIGIYSADPALFGNISYGDNQDQAAVQKARVSGAKTNLVFGLPSPVIKDVHGNVVGNARFVLQGNTLQVVATGLSSIRTPFTIDPSVVITSASDFATGNNEDNINFNAGGGISRGSLTGATVSGGWQLAANNFTTAREQAGSVAYNGYIYIVMGVVYGTSTVNDIQYAPLNSDGSVGTWQNAGASTVTSSATQFQAVAYNGYMYIIGGNQYVIGTGTSHTQVTYATINSNGTLSNWQTVSTLPNSITYAGTVAYNGYMYIAGGGPNGGAGSYYSAVYYAPINADGSLGTWVTSTNSLLEPVGVNQAVAYNGYIYVIGGADTGYLNTVEYAKINSDGSLGAFAQTTPFGCGARYGQVDYAYNGYLYLAAGWGGGGCGSVNGRHNDVQYAQINANGTLGTWQQTASMSASYGMQYVVGAAYNGYIYVMAGRNQAGTADSNQVQYAKIDPAGVAGLYQTNTNAINASSGHWGGTSVAYGGYIYILGGVTGASNSTATNAVYYAQLNSDGSTGAWAATSSFTTARFGLAAVAYNGYMYVIGGFNSGSYLSDVQYAPINTNGTLGSWASAGSAYSTTGRANFGAAVYAGYLYVFGGDYNNNSSVSAETDVGQIQSNGTVSGWTTTGNLVMQTSEFATAQVGPYLYMFGGRQAGTGSSSNANTVEYAVLGSSGTVTWATTSSFTNGRNYLTAGASNGFVYITGGNYGSGTNVYNDTQYAQICTTTSTVGGCNGTVGTLGTWYTTSSFTTARMGEMSATYNGYMYVMGGCSNQGLLGNCSGAAAVLSDVQYVPLNNGGTGSAGTWTTSANTFTYARSNHQTVAYNGYLYLMGGTDPSGGCPGTGGTCDDVQYAPITSSGDIGAWQSTTAFGTSRTQFAAVAYNGYLYVFGGEAGGANVMGSIQYAPINANGSVGSWVTSPNSMITASFGLSAAVYNGYIYAMGGCTTISLGSCIKITNTVQYTPINADGSVGSWVSATSLPSALMGPETLAYNGYLYALGGCVTYNTSNACSSYTNGVQYAQISSNGSLGTWQSTSSFTTGRFRFGAAVYDGNMYIYGGTSSANGFMNDVQTAPILASGALGSWNITSSFATGRFGLGSAAYNGYIYVVGGCTNNVVNCGSGGAQSDTQYAPLASIARIGHYSKLVNLGANAIEVEVDVSYTAMPPHSSQVTYRVAASNGVLGASKPAGTATNMGPCSGIAAYANYVFISVTLDDTAAAVFPDSAGTAANVTNLTINFNPVHPAPNIRLRLGQTLQAGALSPFDTCYP